MILFRKLWFYRGFFICGRYYAFSHPYPQLKVASIMKLV